MVIRIKVFLKKNKCIRELDILKYEHYNIKSTILITKVK